MSTNGTPPSSPLSIKYPPYAGERGPGSARYLSGRIPAPGETRPGVVNNTNSSEGSIWGRFVAWLGFSGVSTRQLHDRMTQLESEVVQLRGEKDFLKKKIAVLEERYERFTSSTKTNGLNDASYEAAKGGEGQAPSGAEDLRRVNERISQIGSEIQGLARIMHSLNQGFQYPALPAGFKDRVKPPTSPLPIIQVKMVEEPALVPEEPPQVAVNAVTKPGSVAVHMLTLADINRARRSLKSLKAPTAEMALQDAKVCQSEQSGEGDPITESRLAADIRAFQERIAPAGATSASARPQEVHASAAERPLLIQKSTQQDIQHTDVSTRAEQKSSAAKAAHKATMLRLKTIGGSAHNADDLKNALQSLNKVKKPDVAGSMPTDPALVERGLPQKPARQDAPRFDGVAKVEQGTLDAKAANKAAVVRRRTIDGRINDPKALQNARASLHKVEQPNAAGSMPTDPAPGEESSLKEQRRVEQDMLRFDTFKKVEQEIPAAKFINQEEKFRRRTIGGSVDNIKDLHNARASLNKIKQASATDSQQIDKALVEGSLPQEQKPVQQNTSCTDVLTKVEQEPPAVDVVESTTVIRNGVKDFCRRFEGAIQSSSLNNGFRRLSLVSSNVQKAASSAPDVDEKPSALAEIVSDNLPKQSENIQKEDTQQVREEKAPIRSALHNITPELLVNRKAELRKYQPNPYI